MNARGLRRSAWWLLAAALLVTPAIWLLLRDWIARMASTGVGGDGLAMVLVLGISVAAFLLLIASMLFFLAHRVQMRDDLAMPTAAGDSR